MLRDTAEILKDLADAVVEMEEQKAVELAHEALSSGVDPYIAVADGLSKGMERVGKRYESGEYFIPQLIVCSDTLYAGLEVIRPHMGADDARILGKAVIGVVEGDTHDIGKNLVKIMMEASGFSILDMGRDVPLHRFVDEAERFGAHVICMSALMTTAMGGMEEVIRRLAESGIREKYKVLIGGGPISLKFAHKIGADGYASNAAAAAKKARALMGDGHVMKTMPYS